MIEPYMKWILLVSGILTTFAIFIFLYPGRFYQSVFKLERVPVVYIFVARHWGLLLSMTGLLLVYAAFNEKVWDLAIVFASVEKMVFIGMVMFGPLNRSRVFTRLAIGDGLIVLLFALYFFGI